VITHLNSCGQARIACDVCIIGAGAAGLTVATELAVSPLSVVVLESGGHRIEPRMQALLRSDVTGLAHGGIHGYRYRVLGGATTKWAGQALPLYDVDFSKRGWVPDSGWPIGMFELQPYYWRAARVLGVPPFGPEQAKDWPPPLVERPRLDPQLVVTRFSEFAAQPNFVRTLVPQLVRTPNVRIILGATVVALVTDQSGSEVVCAHSVSLEGRRLDVTSKVFVVCAGGIDTARLLLVSDQRQDGGVGNSRDLVGRYFQDHPGVTVARIDPPPRAARPLVDTFRPRKHDGIKYQPLFQLSEALQRDEQLLNSGGAVLFHMTQNQSIDAGKVLLRAVREPDLRAQTPEALRTVARHPVPLLAAGWRYFVRGEPALDPTAPPLLTVSSEQAPNPDSRITLVDDRDEAGVRRVALDWRLSGREIATWRRLATVIANELARLELGRVRLEDFQLPDDPAELSGIAVDVGHHMGTARMSDTPERGVVDPSCRVFGVDNLYLASAAVFPTSGFSNPTFTVLALAIRLADELKRHLVAHSCV
jgi:choline dehydrogenase-like flavoprotein